MYTERPGPMGSALWRAQSSPSAEGLSPRSSASIIAADGCVDVLWLEDDLWIAGPMTVPIWDAPRNTPTIGIRIPQGLGGFVLEGKLPDLRDQRVPASEILPPKIVSELRNAGSARRIGPALAVLVARAAESADPRKPIWVQAVRAAACAGMPAAAAARTLSLSDRQFRRTISASFGYGYRTLVGIVRVRTALRHLRNGIAPAAVAGLAGFADQAHLTREIRRYAGLTPGQVRSTITGRQRGR